MSFAPVVEDVPAFKKRDGDLYIQGSNNALVVCGTDRPGSVDSGYGGAESVVGGRGSGTVHVVVGRRAEDPSLVDDSASVYVSMRTDVDTNLGIDVQGRSDSVSAVVARADSVRVSARRDVKMVVEGTSYIHVDGGKVVVDGRRLNMGANAQDQMVRGTAANVQVMSPMSAAATSLASAAAGAAAPAAVPGAAADPVSAGSVVALAAAVAAFATSVASATAAFPSVLSNKSYVE